MKRPFEPLKKSQIEHVIQKTQEKAYLIGRGIAFDPEILNWLNQHRGEANLSVFVNELLKLVIDSYERKEISSNKR